MRAAAFAFYAAFSVAVWAGGAAAGDVDALDREAANYVGPCPLSAGPHEAEWCEMTRKAFMGAYRRAWSGDTWSQKDVSGMLGAGQHGIIRNPVQACAWRMVAAFSDPAHLDQTELATVHLVCDAVGAEGLAAAKVRAEQVLGKFKAAGVVPNSGDAAAD